MIIMRLLYVIKYKSFYIKMLFKRKTLIYCHLDYMLNSVINLNK